jgi:hypothetical protein
MSLFGLADIKFNKQDTPKGPLRALEGSEFDTSALRYPSDIGNYDKGHYMVFYIREQKATSFSSAAGNFGDDSSIIDNASQGSTFQNTPLVNNSASNFGSGLLSKLNSGLSTLNSATGGALSGITGSISSGAGSLVGGINNLFGQKPTIVSGDAGKTQSLIGNSIKKITNNSFIKTTRLTKEAIALYMPETLMFTHQQSYDGVSIGGEALGQAAAAGKSFMDVLRERGVSEATGSLFKSAAAFAGQRLANVLGGSGQVGLQALAGIATNPLLEMIYKSPNFRTFQFDFMFYPRDEKEAYEVQKIIESFRFHQAPEFVQGAQGFLIPPSEFDIRFYYGGQQNPNIPQIATCVLNTMDVDYAPNGWSAYEIPGDSKPNLGSTGMPVAIKMTLQFTEKEYFTKEDFRDDRQSTRLEKFAAQSQSGQFGTS